LPEEAYKTLSGLLIAEFGVDLVQGVSVGICKRLLLVSVVPVWISSAGRVATVCFLVLFGVMVFVCWNFPLEFEDSLLG
jgi:hypothetical protein